MNRCQDIQNELFGKAVLKLAREGVPVRIDERVYAAALALAAERIAELELPVREPCLHPRASHDSSGAYCPDCGANGTFPFSEVAG